MSLKNEGLAANSGYYSHLQMPVIEACKPGFKTVLEIGCAGGETLAYLKTQGAEKLFGIELREDVAAIARARSEIDEVYVADFTVQDLPFEEGTFDLIIVSFVLEHIIDPWSAVKKIAKYLKPGGQLVGSLPNVRHASVVLPLLFTGEFRYREEGIMDWTHAKFFSSKTILDLLNLPIFTDVKLKPWVNGRKYLWVDRATLGLLRNFLCFAYVFSAIKNKP